MSAPGDRTEIILMSGSGRIPQPARERPSGSLIWLLVVSSVLGVVMPIMLYANIPDTGRSGAWILTMIFIFWSGCRLATIISAGQPRLYEFFFWLFVYIFFGLAPSVQIRGDLVSTTTPGMSSALDWPTAIFIGASLIAFELGVLTYRARQPVGSTADKPARKINLRAAWTLMAVGLVGMLYYASRLGLASFFESRDARDTARQAAFADAATASIFSAFSWIPLIVAAGAFAWLRRERKAAGLSGRYGPLVILAALCVLVVVNPISGARFTSGTVLFALISYTGIFRTPGLVRLSMAGLVGAFMFLFPILDAFRTSTASVRSTGLFLEYASNPDYDSFWQVANSISYVTAEGITWGRQFLGVLFSWMPRAIWPSKPIDTGILLANFRGYSFTNLSAPVWSESIVNVGRPFSILIIAIIGFTLAGLDSRLPGAFAVGGPAAITGAIFPAYMVILLRGSMLQASGAFFVMLASVIFVARRPANDQERAKPDIKAVTGRSHPSGVKSARLSPPTRGR